MRIDYLRYFKRLAEVQNYTKAAQDLYIAQPTLSIAIKRMEESLGFGLFNRVSKGTVELTESGRVFYEFACKSIYYYEMGIQLAKEKQGEINANLNLGTIYAMQGKFFSRALNEFEKSCKKAPTISIKQAYSKNLVDMVKRNELDACFCSYIDNEPSLNFTLCWSQPLVLGVNKSNPLASRKSISFEELHDVDILTYSTTSPVAPGIDDIVSRYNLRAYRGYDDEVTLSSLVSRNEQSIALFCYSFLVNAFEDVVCLRINEAPLDFHKVYLVSRKETHSQVVDSFLDFMGGYNFPNILDETE